ncbi:GHKL domain-containing protein [Vallitalea pronyensis]|uniref:GHKL domain-containing protein n=1 Tax=Vallitalea pronyensis TaxID=1348613 RepID=A0A8J8SG53_9FIRM|nr:GHKL domain-containing protein [Vallitalea pronyensis]QUI21943.1 GHKL domain-containing protein [Vallitalea pronyensis]
MAIKNRKKRQLSNIGKYIQLLYLIQVLLLIAMVLYRLFSRYSFIKLGFNWRINMDIVLLFIAFLMLINGYLVIKDVVDLKRWKERIKMKDEAYDYVQKLNQDLRMQRHDFLNHIQIIYSLNELEEYEACRDYLNKIYEHIGKLSENIKTDRIAINALLQAKANEAQRLHILYQVSIRSRLSDLVMPDWELCRCLGNLIDNAFTATLQYHDCKQVSIHIEENIKDYILTVSNTGNPIGEHLLASMFERGVTTKNNQEEHGMGLYIVKSVLEQYNGEVSINHTSPHTSLVMQVPKPDITSNKMYNTDKKD